MVLSPLPAQIAQPALQSGYFFRFLLQNLLTFLKTFQYLNYDRITQTGFDILLLAQALTFRQFEKAESFLKVTTRSGIASTLSRCAMMIWAFAE